MSNARQPIEPKQLFGVNFNIRDHKKFNQALQLLRESTGGIPMFAADNVITWNRNLSFMRQDFFSEILSGDESDAIEKSCIWRLYILLYFAESCQHLEGDYVELGCHKGATAKRLTERVDFQALGKRYWLYDLFGWSEGDEHTHMPGHDNPRMYEDVVDRFADQPWVQVIRGSVPGSFSQGFPDRIAFAHIDMNHPTPESGALEVVLPRLSPGGFIVFDDYGWWGYSAQKRALDPIAASHGFNILELPTGQGLLLKR
jgi:O-methyltransferase